MYQSSPAFFWLLWLLCGVTFELVCSSALGFYSWFPLVFAFYFICPCNKGEVWTQLGEPLRCSPGFALAELWLLRLQPEMLVFHCGGTRLCKEVIRHHWHCIVYRQNGNMLSDATKQSSRLLEKAEKTLPCLARLGWVVVLWRQVLTALQNPSSVSVTDWVRCSFPGVTGRITLSSPKWGEVTTLCDHTTVAGRSFSFRGISSISSHLKQSIAVLAALVHKNWSVCCVSGTNQIL